MNLEIACVLCVVIFTAGGSGISQNHPKGRNRNISELSQLGIGDRATRDGYTVSEHAVQTEDGYVLTMFRLQRPGGGGKGPPVLLMHGLLLSAASWIDAGPGTALAYLIADAGYDLWLGNVRGSYYSRQHAWLDPDTDSQYWKFCIQEMGQYDLPASIDYILSETGAQKINYIGFSQGGGAFFIMCSERPEYREKVNVMIALAPATRQLNTRSAVFRIITEYYEMNEDELMKSGSWEALPKGGILQSLFQNFCTISDVALDMCELIKDVLDSPNRGSLKKLALRATVSGFPAGTSVHNMASFGLNVKSKDFQKFDYGREQNLVRYGSMHPPVYNLSAATIPTALIYGKNDGIVDIRDVKWLLGKLPNVIEAREMEDPFWTHFDFVINKNIPKLLFPKVKRYLSVNSIV